MSLLSSEDEYTEEELLHVCEDLGLPCDEENIGLLKEAIDEIILESEFESEEGSNDVSLFGSLSLSDSSQPMGRSTPTNAESFSSPIRRIDRRSARLYRREETQSRNRDVPLNLPSSQENEELRRHNPSAYFLLNDAWRCLSSIYGTMSIMENLQLKLSATRTWSSKNRSKQLDIPGFPPRGDDKENLSRFPQYPTDGPSGCTKRTEQHIESDPSNGTRSLTARDKFECDPSIRRVNRFVPGQLLYRHDPVKKFELYREEWARKPTPGEQKRLALRWKVREYMLRHDMPVFDPRKRTASHTVHPKDWSPRPYLD
ncbi:hypothetical protein RB195_014050 [Necator americanus]|uniref:Centriolar and ciliogenesis-associated protein HYLS1 C-terminal domain-containing protein n=1 Tax=Necator americanus TaxID=51031 RepID=A0ABR1DYE5_NECAM